MPDFEDYYQMLGVAPDATPEEIELAYKNKLWILHPDRMVGAPEPAKKQAEEELKRVNNAHDTLKDPQKRQVYDQQWHRIKDKPKPVIDPQTIRFDNINPMEVQTGSFVIRNFGGPYSRINISNPNTWVKVARWHSLSDTDELPLQVEIEALGEDFGKTYTEQIKVNLDDEEIYVSIELRTLPHNAPAPGSGIGTSSSSSSSGTRPGHPAGNSGEKSNRTKGVLISTGILSIIFVVLGVVLYHNVTSNINPLNGETSFSSPQSTISTTQGSLIPDTSHKSSPTSTAQNPVTSKPPTPANTTPGLAAQGNLLIWGSNAHGELGNGTTIASSVPVQISGLTGVIAITAGSEYSLALKSDGTVWAWGNNSNGQLGNGTTTDSNVPIQVNKLSGVIAIAAYYKHNLAIRSDGTVWAWGFTNAQNIPNQSNIPLQVSNLNKVIAIAGTMDSSLALKSDGTVWAWTSTSSVPVQVSGLTQIVAITGAQGGQNNNLALKSDGTVWAWGNNIYGQLGNGTTTRSDIPVQVRGITQAVAIAAGGIHGLAVRSDGTVWAWGFNRWGQLGNNTTIDSYIPIQVNGLTGVVSVAAGTGCSLAMKSNGAVWAWGNNSSGQLGNGTTIDSSVPVQISGLTGVIAIAAGTDHSLAIKSK